ncbi:MAG: T9SS type A sorting domain-containing protein [Bacteroidia bacterium]|nr:T9SS type A sorting domain-containing protein [Bacteroidia bacterium]
MKKILFGLTVFLLFYYIGDCQTDSIRNIIFLGHTYKWYSDNKIDDRIAYLNYLQYDEIWLGGDICPSTSENIDQLLYVDSILNISRPTTFWALGNHDIVIGHIELIEQVTQRPSYYAFFRNGLTMLILNSNIISPYFPEQDGDCEKLQDQYDLIRSVTDTITVSSHLIIIAGHLVWGAIHGSWEPYSNLYMGDYNFLCSENSTFMDTIYPLLLDVKHRDIDVICLSGDLGQKAKEYEYVSEDSIIFLASGINNSYGTEPDTNCSYVTNFDPDKILILTYYINTQKIIWKFHDLDSLYNSSYGIFNKINDNETFVHVFPNPNNGIFNLSINGTGQETEIKLFDIFGITIYKEPVKETPVIIRGLDISYFPSGIYILTISSKRITRAIKVIRR